MDDPNFNQEREAIQLPKALKGLPIAQDLPSSKQAWNSNEEIASLLIAFEKHKDWKQREIRLRPPSGSMLLYNRKKVSYRRDGYCWKKRKDGKTIREDHMKLKVQGVECIYGSYVHSAVLPTFHRRSYWLLQNPDLVLVHYLNVPYADNSKLTIPTLSYYLEKKQWSKEELVDQLRPMLFTGACANHEETESVEETIAVIVKQLLDHQDKHFKSKLHKCDALCDKNCTLRCISPKREDKFVGSNINSRLASLLERNSQGSNIARSAHVIGDSGNILLASSGAQPIATLTAINNDQGSTQSAAPIILNLSNLQGRNGIIILSGQTHTPISIINTSQTQQPPITSDSCNIEPGSCMVPQEASVPKHNHINLGKDDVCVNVPMQISSVTEDLSMPNSTVNTTKPACVNMFPQADFSLPQSVLQQLSVSQADLPTSTPPNQSSAIPSTSCDEFKNDLPFPPPSELSLDNLDLLDFADMDKLCSGWSDISVDVASNSIPQSSFNLATDDKSISLLNCTNSLGSQDISQQQSSNLSHLGNHPHGSNPFQQLQTVLSDAQLISSINLTAQTPLYTNSTNASVTQSSASQFCHAHPHLINQEHQQAVPVQHTSQQQQHNSIQQQQHNLQHSQQQQRHTTQHNSLQQQHGVQRHQLPHQHSLQSQDAQPSHLHSHHALQQQQQRQPVPQNPPMQQQQQHPSVLLASPLRNLPSLHSDMKKDPTATLDNVKSDSLSDISDFSPDWSYTEGGTKVLITGPWVTTSNKYAIMFDNKSISATLVQPGVLRCFAPEHTEGLVTLEVSLNDHIISNSVVFEYKRRERREATPGHGDWFSVDENQLQLMLLDRLAQLEKKLASNCITKVTDDHDQSSEKPSDREGQLIAYCQLLSQRLWLSNDPLPKLHSHGCCLLHLASALGYEKLIQHLIHWRSQSSSVVLEKEVDAESLDNYSATPLMWACAKGHVNAVLCLYACSNTPMKLCNKDGLSPLDVARRNGHHTLAEHLEMLEQDTAMLTDQTQLDLGSAIPDLNQFLLDPKGDHPLTKPTVIPSISSETLSTYCPAVLSLGGGANPAPPLSSLHIDIPSPPKYSTTNTKLGRRFSEQTSASILRRRFNKGFSMETFPGSSITNYCSTEGMDAHQALRIANSEPDLGANIEGLSSGDNPMISDHCHSPDLLLQTESLLGIHRLSEQDDNVFASMSRAFQPVPQQHSSPSNQVVAMDTDEISSIRSVSPFIDVEKVSSDDEELLSLTQQAAALSESSSAEGQHQMVTLANQIIAAMPERIKSSPSRCDEGVVTECHRGRSESHSSIASQNSPPQSLYGDDSGISTPLGEGHSFEEFRYREIDTPASSLSPDSTCLPSPYSPYSFLLDSPPPTTADFNEYFNAPTTYLEKDFSQLTLSDHEQRKLYEAAKLIQNAFRIYRDKQQQQQQLQKEIEAAILIQSYYRRYKQYIYFKKMTQAAVLIQSQFRSYSAQKRYKKSRDAAVVIQNQYRTYKQHERFKKSRNAAVIIQQRFRNHYQRKQNQEMASTLLQMASDSNDKLPGFPYIIEQCYSSTVTELSCARCKHFNQRRPNMCRH